MTALTKTAIMKAFAELAEEKPFDKITVKDITDRCGISRNTFYYHFQDIFHVLQEFAEYQNQLIIEHLENAIDAEDFQTLYTRGISLLIKHRGLFYHLIHSSYRDEVRKSLDKVSNTLSDFIIDRFSQDMDVDDADKHLIMRSCQFVLAGFLISWLEDEQKSSLEDTLQRLSLLFGENAIRDALRRSAELKRGCHTDRPVK